jgi:ribosomal-protein-alanine N-acetyltransferase
VTDVRVLGVDHLAELSALEERSQPIPWSEHQLLLELVHDGALVLGAFSDEGSMVGHLCARKMLEELWVLNVVVDPAHRRTGTARALFERVIVWGISRGLSSLWLEVRESNAAARALYAQFHLEERGRRASYYPPLPGFTEREAAILMARPLP